MSCSVLAYTVELTESGVAVDYTAATILDKFQNEAASQAVERVLKKMSGEKATEILGVCDSYISATTTDNILSQVTGTPSPLFHFCVGLFCGVPSTYGI